MGYISATRSSHVPTSTYQADSMKANMRARLAMAHFANSIKRIQLLSDQLTVSNWDFFSPVELRCLDYVLAVMFGDRPWRLKEVSN